LRCASCGGKIVIIARATRGDERRTRLSGSTRQCRPLKTKRDAITRLMPGGLRKGDRLSYANRRRSDYFAEFAKVPRDIAKQAVDDLSKASAADREIRSL